MRFKSIIIVTYGRSGSTLLQGIVNNIPKCIVRGENYNFIYSLFDGYRKLENAKKMENKHNQNYNTPQHSWFGADNYDLNLYLKSQKQLIKQLLIADSGAEYYGFKEIRYFEVLNELEEFLSFLELVMEDVAIIFNVRNADDVSNSSWWKKENPDLLIPKLNRANTLFKNIAEKKENAFYFDYDRMIKDSSVIKELYNFLDVKYDRNQIRELLSIEHSGDNKIIRKIGI